MKVLIESSAIMKYLKGNVKVKEIISNSEDFYVSTLTIFEVLLGKVEENKILDFFSAFNVIGLNRKDSITASRIYKRLRDKGKLVGYFDILISAQAIIRGLTLVTKDTDFLKVADEFNELKVALIT